MKQEQNLLEHSWNSVRFGQSYQVKTGNASGQVAASTNWFNRYISTEGDRRSRLFRYNQMDMESIEIARALDTIAEDASCTNKSDESSFDLVFPQETKMKKTLIKMINDMKTNWEKRAQLDTEFYYHVREVLKYGSLFFYKKPDGSLRKIRQEQMVGYILSSEDTTEVTHYLIDEHTPVMNLSENYKTVSDVSISSAARAKKDKVSHVSVDDLLCLKIGVGPFGESILERAYPTWRKMQLVEDAIVIYRVVRAPERRVFYIDVGRLPAQKHEEVIRRYMSKMKQKQIMRNGEVSSEFDPHATTEDFYLPTTSNGRSSKIETLQGGSNTGELSDLTYLARKLAKAMRVPPSMIETHNEGNDRDTYNDMRVGQVMQVEMRYMGFVKRIQSRMAIPLMKHFRWYCLRREVIVPHDASMVILEAHSFALYKEIEVNQAILNVFNSSTQIMQLSKRYAMEKYLNMDEEEIINNEVMKLREMGLTDEVIKSMEDHVIMNLVYGDGRLGKEYGLEPVEANTF